MEGWQIYNFLNYVRRYKTYDYTLLVTHIDSSFDNGFVRSMGYYQSLKREVAGSVLMHSHSNVTDPDQLLMEHYLGTLKKSAVYLVINIGVTIFALCNVK